MHFFNLPANKRQTSETGNVLFLILIAVALFAALSYVVTQSSRSGSGSIGGERARLEASRIYNYIVTVRTAAQRLPLTAGVSETELMFNNDVYKNYDGSTELPMGSPPNPARYVFHPQGGGAIPQTFEKLAVNCDSSHCTDPGFPLMGHSSFEYMRVEGVGTTDPDVTMLIYSPSPQVCHEFNKMSGIGLSGVTFPSDQYRLYVFVDELPYQDSSTVFTPPSGLAPMGANASAHVYGQTQFCYYEVNADDSGNAYSGLRILAVLIAR